MEILICWYSPSASDSIDVEVYGVRQLTADTLMRAATRFVPIDSALLLPAK